jgi:hypothetical protein
MDVVELNEMVLFDVDEAYVVTGHGSRVEKGCVQHACQGLPAIVDRTKYIPIEEVWITCKYCGEAEKAVNSVFTSEDGWKCNLCIKDHAEQAAKNGRK